MLGLTASLVSGKTKPKQLEKQIIELEKAMHSEIEAASDLTTLALHGAKPKIIVLLADDYNLKNDHIILQEVRRVFFYLKN